MPSVDSDIVCPGCGAPLSASSKQCPYCGRPVVLTSLNFKQVRRATYKDSARFLDKYQDVLKNSPNDPKVLASLGYVLFDRGQYQEAAENLEKAVENGSNDSDVLFHIALSRFKSQKPFKIKLKEAESIMATLDSAIEMNPHPQYLCAKAILIKRLFEQRYIRYSQSSKEVMEAAKQGGLTDSDSQEMNELLMK